MYNLALVVHNFTRWLVLLALAWALYQSWSGWIRKREWSSTDQRAAFTLMVIASLQLVFGLVFGLILYLHPAGLAQAAWKDLGVAMKVYDFRFFGFEHPLQMVIAIVLIHFGYHRSKKAPTSNGKHVRAVIFFTLAAIAILTMIPWWRPLVRLF